MQLKNHFLLVKAHLPVKGLKKICTVQLHNVKHAQSKLVKPGVSVNVFQHPTIRLVVTSSSSEIVCTYRVSEESVPSSEGIGVQVPTQVKYG